MVLSFLYTVSCMFSSAFMMKNFAKITEFFNDGE